MEYTVTLQPSGKTYNSHKNETILEAALRAGYNLKYQCDNGTCGGCKIRLLTGDINKIKPGEFVISEAEKERGYFLPCAHEATSNLVIEAEEFSRADEIPRQELAARVRKIEKVSPDVVILQLRTPRTGTLRFLAGQSVMLELPDYSQRTLQVASCPCNGMQLEFHVRHNDQDLFSACVFDRLAVNDAVRVSGPVGDFVLDEASARPLVFIAHDTGFAGIKSLVEHVIALEVAQDILLCRISCEPGKDYLHNICRSWADAIDNLHYQTYEYCQSVSHENALDALDCEDFLHFLGEQTAHDLIDCDIYLSGVEAVVSDLPDWLTRRGVSAGRLKIQYVG